MLHLQDESYNCRKKGYNCKIKVVIAGQILHLQEKNCDCKKQSYVCKIKAAIER